MERISVKDVVGTDIRSRISLNAVKALMTAGKADVRRAPALSFSRGRDYNKVTVDTYFVL